MSGCPSTNLLKSTCCVISFDLENQIRTLLVGEIQRNCDFTLLAYDDMMKCLDSLEPGDKKTLDRFWLGVESFLISVANISKILWPPSGSTTEVYWRRAALRIHLSVDDTSPIKSKEFRNHFEHYDTRIERWAKGYFNKKIVDSNIGPIDSVIIGANDTLCYMRNFDPYKFTLHLGGEEYDINQVMTTVKELLAKTKAH
jgi:hypothetical protein